MKQALYGIDQSEPPLEPQQRTVKEKYKVLKINIVAISGAIFQHHLNNKNSETFMTSLYEIN
jgi:hypothetical protein